MTDSAIHRIRHLQTQRDELLERADLLAERCDILQAERDAYEADLNDASGALTDREEPSVTTYALIAHLFELDAFRRAATILDALERSRETAEALTDPINQDLHRLLEQIAEAPETT